MIVHPLFQRLLLRLPGPLEAIPNPLAVYSRRLLTNDDPLRCCTLEKRNNWDFSFTSNDDSEDMLSFLTPCLLPSSGYVPPSSLEIVHLITKVTEGCPPSTITAAGATTNYFSSSPVPSDEPTETVTKDNELRPL
ncbi:hypothetical protein D5086_001770 [Populus alba]|uniref:Uncharacterized protein n=1 Tax=Populus alba TaxID=43335 RepID=A0ACC4D0T0_POPAL